MSSLNLYGIEIINPNQTPSSMIPIDAVQSDASITYDQHVDGTNGAAWGLNRISSLPMDVAAKEENKLITQYRELINTPEIDLCIEEITQEAIIYPNDGENAIDVDLSNLDDSIYTEKVKEAIAEEFKEVYDLLLFNRKGHDIFKRWLVDGRINYYKIVDSDNITDGIQALTYIDPRKIKKVQESNRVIDKDTGKLIVNNYKEFFYYNEDGVKDINEERAKAEGRSSIAQNYNNSPYGNKNPTTSVNILTRDSVAYAPSGILDASGKMVIGYLHKVMKTANNLQLMEDSMLIYKLSRAPERRVFYIDTGNLPKAKAESYVKAIADKYRTKVVYDAKSGEIKNDRKFNALTEDFWLPRSGGSKGTEISTLPGGMNTGDTEEVEYFKDKLFDSLGVPKARFDDQPSMFGQGTQITRDEIRFSRLISRLRTNFNVLFEDILGTQLVLRNIVSITQWEDIKNKITFKYAEDNYFKEAVAIEKNSQIANLVSQFDALTGKWVSKEYVYKNIMMLTDEEIKEMEKQIKNETDTSLEADARLSRHELELANAEAQQDSLENPPEEETEKPSPKNDIKKEGIDYLSINVINEMF